MVNNCFYVKCLIFRMGCPLNSVWYSDSIWKPDQYSNDKKKMASKTIQIPNWLTFWQQKSPVLECSVFRSPLYQTRIWIQWGSKFRRVQILNGPKQVGCQMVQMTNGFDKMAAILYWFWMAPTTLNHTFACLNHFIYAPLFHVNIKQSSLVIAIWNPNYSKSKLSSTIGMPIMFGIRIPTVFLTTLLNSFYFQLLLMYF